MAFERRRGEGREEEMQESKLLLLTAKRFVENHYFVDFCAKHFVFVFENSRYNVYLRILAQFALFCREKYATSETDCHFCPPNCHFCPPKRPLENRDFVDFGAKFSHLFSKMVAREYIFEFWRNFVFSV